MSATDALFYALALVFAGAAAWVALARDLRTCARAALVQGLSAAFLLALLQAWLAAAALTVVVAAGFGALRRAQAPEPLSDDASTPASRLRAATLILAFFVITLRSVLMARWPLATFAERADVAVVPAVGFTHYLVVSLVVLALGLYAAISRRTIAGVGLGLGGAIAAAVVALGAAAHFVPGPGEAHALAALVVVLGAATAATIVRIAAASGDLARPSEPAWRVAGGLAAALSGVTLALLASAW